MSIRTGADLDAATVLSANQPIQGMAFSPDGELLAVFGAWQCTFWAPEGANRWGRQFGATVNARSLAWAPDGDSVALGGDDCFVRHAIGSEPQDRFAVPRLGQAQAIAFAPDGRTIALGGRAGEEAEARTQPGAVIGWDVARGRPVGPAGSHARPVQAVGFTPDGRYLVSAGLDRAVKFWDRDTMALRCTLEWHLASVLCLAFSPDGETLATGSADGSVKLWPWRILVGGAPTA